MSDIIRIALIGPESSGKTTMASELAKKFHTQWVPEFARAYVEKLNRPYNKEDILFCAKMQLETEKEIIKEAYKFLFADTELINYSVWLKDVYDETDEWIEKNISDNKYDLYLLMSPDLPFVNDPVRENEYRRDYFFNWYKRELEERGLRYSIIKGIGDERVSRAVEKITNDKSGFAAGYPTNGPVL